MAVFPQSLWVIGLMIVVLIGLWALTNRTRIGKQMTATANDPGAASLSGVNTGRMIILAFAISAAIGALGGIAVTPINSTNYLSGGIYALSGFVAAILGGWGSSTGAVVGGLALGIIQSLATGFCRPATRTPSPTPSSSWSSTSGPAVCSACRRARGRRDEDGHCQASSAAVLLGRGERSSSRPCCVVVLVVWPLLYQNGYTMRIMTTGGLFTMLTVAVVVILGQAGQLSFAHSAFYGIGAYTAALLAMKASVPTFAALIIGALVAGVIALVVGRPVLKLRYFYLALATIGLGQIFLVLVIQLRTVTGSTIGLAPIPYLKIFGFTFGTQPAPVLPDLGGRRARDPVRRSRSQVPHGPGSARRSPPARSPRRLSGCGRPTGSSSPL